MIPDDPSISQGCKRRVDLLTLVLGFKKKMLEIPSNLDDILNQQLKNIADCYKLIFNLLTTATNKNQLVS